MSGMSDAVREAYPKHPPIAWVVCDCDGHAITVHDDAEAQMRNEPEHHRFVALGLWERDPTVMPSFRERIRRAWRWLLGKPPIHFDVVLNRQETEKLRQALGTAQDATWPFWEPPEGEDHG